MTLRLFTIPADVAFLPALARAILSGSLSTPASPPAIEDLPHWTVLLPTRRAARNLSRSFLSAAGRAAMLLPRIRPIGDVDEDLLAPEIPSGRVSDEHLVPAISALEREALLIRLIDEWAATHPQERLAFEIADSPSQAIALAQSLAELLDTFETEEIDLNRLPDLFTADLAEHRNSILSFLSIIREKLPVELFMLGRLGPMERRSRLLRLEARRLAETAGSGPIIAAGSTGSIPAAAELLRTIASLPFGAVILPGLDQTMSQDSWQHVGPQHPQFGLKRLLDSWHVKREEVELLPGTDRDRRNEARVWLTSEVMRPTPTASAWRETLLAGRGRISQGMDKVTLVQARDHHQEAQVIALVMRETLEDPNKTAALVTPDRDLARRVVSTLKRWGIEIDDSAGEPLIRRPLGSAIAALIDFTLTGFATHEFAKLLHHPLVHFGWPAHKAGKAQSIIDLALLRDGRDRLEPGTIAEALERARRAAGANEHPHETLRRLADGDWTLAHDYALKMDSVLGELAGDQAAHKSLGRHIGIFVKVLAAIADETADPSAAEALDQLVQSMEAAEHFLPVCGRPRALMLLATWLRRLPVRLPLHHPRLAILGLLEARLISPDLVILGGLTEGSWPAQPDPGPWINRPMRAVLDLAQPERSIGLTAHDFAQAFGAKEVVLTWSTRVKDQPAVASRWILRLNMILAAAGISSDAGRHWLAWARGFDDAQGDRRAAMPRPKPPVAARPRSLSITQVEKLMRDPYRIYAEKVLRLQPLAPIGAVADPGLKGNLIHKAFNVFANAYTTVLPEDAEAQLIRIGREVFAPYFADADVSGFWWPRFERIVPWFIAEERQLREGVVRSYAELGGAYRFDGFTLTGRADRIDVLGSGKARLVDYKTGRIPTSPQVKSGLAPQLTLEAALLAEGGFAPLAPMEAAELYYIKLSGGEPPGLILPVAEIDVMAKAREHLEKFKALMRAYDDESHGYIPRAAMEKEQDTSLFDHLSRWREWSLAEEES